MLSEGLRIMTFNIWDLPLSLIKSRRKRMKLVLEYLMSLTVDIIFLQEVWYGDTQMLFQKALTTKGYDATTCLSQKAGFSNGTGGLMIFSKFPLQHVTFTPFSPISLPLSERIGKKGMLSAEIDTPVGKIHIANLHLYQPESRVRIGQLEIALKQLDHESSAATLLGGDFNQDKMWEQPAYAKRLEQANFSEAREVAQTKLETHRLANSYAHTWTNRITMSGQLDYILFRNFSGLKLKPVTYNPDYLPAPLSDHDPLFLALH